MLHFFSWELLKLDDMVYVKNEFFWIKGYYFWYKKKGEFFLYPFLDTNHNTFYYAIFDDFRQLEIFNRLIKISWIGLKTANYISTFFDFEDIKKAISSSDIDFFTQIPGIGTKTAKKIIFELKDKVDLTEIDKADELAQKKKKIITTLTNLGYNKSKVEAILKDIKQIDDLQQVIQEIIKKL